MKVIGKNNGHVYLYGNVAGAHVALSKTFFRLLMVLVYTFLKI